jgi:nucleotide-binding universal stress UspA family protein
MKGIVVGVDGSEGAAYALRWAVLESTLRDLPVVAVLAWGYLDQHFQTADHVFDPAYGESDALAALDGAVRDAIGEAAAATVDRQVVCDLAARGLVEAAADAELLVVGARGLGGFRGLLLGSVSQQCLHHTRRPLAIVHPTGRAAENGDRVERIVVGVDGSPPAERALRWAMDEARVRRARVQVVHAWREPVSLVGAAPSATVTVDAAELEVAGHDILDGAVDAVDTAGLAHPPERVLVNGGPALAILDLAGGADLVVVGSRGRGGFAGLVLGSVSQQVAMHARCPVVVLPPRRAADASGSAAAGLD